METSDSSDSSDAGPADPSGILRGIASVLVLWGAGFLAAHFLWHTGTWTVVVGVVFCAIGVPLRRIRRPVTA